MIHAFNPDNSLNENGSLDLFSGSDTFYRYNFASLSIIITQGVNHVAESYQCFWLIDAIISHQLEHNNHPFQVWNLIRVPGTNSFNLIGDDGNNNVFVSQHIPFSDFEADHVRFYFTNNTLLLPSEN